MSKVTTQTLALLVSTELHADKNELARLQAAVIDQMRIMRRLRGEEALRGLLVGTTLLRIKHAIPHGQFGPWIEANITTFSGRYSNYLMRLALEFVDRTKVTKPELLALPGDQTELAIETMEGAQRRFFEKAAKFVGELSLNELLIKYNIKAVGLKSELSGAGEADDAGLTPEQRGQHDRDTAWLGVWNPVQAIRQTLTDPNKLQLLEAGRLEQLKAELVEAAKLATDRLAALRAIKI